jgi:hypothetical protein
MFILNLASVVYTIKITNLHFGILDYDFAIYIYIKYVHYLLKHHAYDISHYVNFKKYY